ncbi:MAG: hypothetical protein L6435_03925 [Anaerolineae bacterium]|nr:hypothetical protein [Anaerolineae bacterium]
MNRDLLLLAGLGLVGVMVILAFLDDLGRLARSPIRRLRAVMAPYLTRIVLVPVGVSTLLAILYPGILLKFYFLVAGCLVGWYLLRKSRQMEGEVSLRQISQMILAFRGVYQLQPSVFSSLSEVSKKLAQPLKGLSDAIVKTYYLTSSAERAFEEFRTRTDNVYLHQFVYILEMSETAHPEAVVTALDGFADRLRRHVELRRVVDTSLASITGQVSFLQILSLIIVFAVGVIPALSQAYSSPVGQLMFVVIATIGLGASYYIERKVSSLKERIR